MRSQVPSPFDLESESLRQTHHGHSVKIPQTLHPLQQAHDDSSSLDRLDRPRQQIRSDGLEILQDEHVERLTENLVRVFVVPTDASTNR